MVVAVGTGIASGFMLHSAADLERQTLRIQRFTGAVFQLQNYTLEAQGRSVGKGLVQERAEALEAANTAFDNMRKHDPDDGLRLRPTYLAYLAGSEQAFTLALTDGGQIGLAEQQRVERQLAAFAGAVDREV